VSREGESCCAPGTRCGPDSAALDRREVIWASAVGAVGLATSSSWRAFAGPFDLEAGSDFPIPADKKLDPKWIDSLFARGEPTV
jgi:hypothetical protein